MKRGWHSRCVCVYLCECVLVVGSCGFGEVLVDCCVWLRLWFAACTCDGLCVLEGARGYRLMLCVSLS